MQTDHTHVGVLVEGCPHASDALQGDAHAHHQLDGGDVGVGDTLRHRVLHLQSGIQQCSQQHVNTAAAGFVKPYKLQAATRQALGEAKANAWLPTRLQTWVQLQEAVLALLDEVQVLHCGCTNITH